MYCHGKEIKQVLEQLKEIIEKFTDKPNHAELFKINEVSKMFNVSTTTVIDWIKDGEMRFIKQGRCYYFRKEHLLELKQRLEKEHKIINKDNSSKIGYDKLIIIQGKIIHER